MKRLVALLLLLSSLAGAQIIRPNSGARISGSFTANCIPKAVTAVTLQCSAVTDNGTLVTSTEPIVVPAGTITSPSIQWAETTANAGWYRNGANVYEFSIGNSTVPLRFQGATSGAVIVNTMLGISTNPNSTLADLFIRRRGAGNLQLGNVDVNGTPVAQTISVQNAITGSNLNGGATFSLAASLGTGTGTPGTLVITGGDSSVASGATAQTQITRATFNSTKSLTTGAATTAVSIPLATLQMTGGTIDYYIEATDGTNQCTSKNTVQYAAENSAGVFKATVTKVIATSVTNCTGATTLTEAWAMSGANPSLIQVTPTLTGITATRFTMIYEVHHMGNTVPTI